MTAVPRIRTGDVITADYLNDIGEKVNQLDIAINPPKLRNEALPADLQNVNTETEEDIVRSTAYIESNRIVSIIRVFDDAGTNYADIERIDRVDFVNADGDDLELYFNNT